MGDDLLRLPPHLPVPEDDGAAAHLTGARLPNLILPAASGGQVDLGRLSGTAVLFVFPMIGHPERSLPDGWDAVPGARGCTAEACAFRSVWDRFADLEVSLTGVSRQSSADQQEARTRLELPFELASDAEGRLERALRLPAFEVDGSRYLRRLTLVSVDGSVVKVFYPVFPPDRHPDEVLAWIQGSRSGTPAATGEGTVAAD